MTITPNRHPEGTPAGGQFAVSTHPEPEGISLTTPEPAEELCDECGDEKDDDGTCMNCQCGECGETLNNGEGYDGLCGNCADAEEGGSQIFDMQLRNAEGEYSDFSVNRLDDGHYEVEDGDGNAVLEFYHSGDEEDHDSIQENAVEALNGAGHKVSE